jgi:phage gp29-like protein
MKLLTDKKITEIKKAERLDVFKNITKRVPQQANAIDRIIQEQLERVTKEIDDWRTHVSAAEDIDNPDRQGLMEFFRDFVDDYQLFATMQSRTNKAISGSFKIMDESGDIDEEENKKFIDPQGFPLPWFRNFMRYVMDSKFYGWEAIQLGSVVNDRFVNVEKIPEENQIPYYDSMIIDVNTTFIHGSNDNSIYFGDDPYNTWVVRVGSRTDLGLINKCAPYIIWKSIFGNWSQHASIFGMPLRVGRTSLTDKTRKQNMIDAFEAATGADYLVMDDLDQVEFIESKGSSDPHKIYGTLVEKCDQAISKIILSQTGTTDEKAFAGSANVHENVLDDLIFSDKLDIKSVVNDMLIPRMKKIGMISESKKIFGGWDYAEKLSIGEWSEIVLKLSQAGYSVSAESVEKKTGMEIDETIITEPENKSLVMNKITKLYGKDNS